MKQRHETQSLPIERANEADLSAIHSLLETNGLPIDDLGSHIGSTLLVRDHTNPARIVGSAALELYTPYALLRSVAVDEDIRGRGLGIELTRAALDLARDSGAHKVYLLTETASDFFPRFGFRAITRQDVPGEVLRSVEFTTACPDSALVMELTLDADLPPEKTTQHQTTRIAEPADAADIARIYNEGIEDRIGTFETRPRTPQDILSWFDGTHPVVVVEENGAVIAFAATSSYRSRECYAGIAEYSVYVARSARGRGAGRLAMEKLIEEAEKAGFWKLLSRIFPQNTASLSLAHSLGFREVGIYEKHARLDGVWRDVVIVEKLLHANID